MQRKLLGPSSFACSVCYRSFVLRNIFPAADWEIRDYPAGLGLDMQLRGCFDDRKPVVDESTKERGGSAPAQSRERAD